MHANIWGTGTISARYIHLRYRDVNYIDAAKEVIRLGVSEFHFHSKAMSDLTEGVLEHYLHDSHP